MQPLKSYFSEQSLVLYGYKWRPMGERQEVATFPHDAHHDS